MRVFVTGASGWIGSASVRELLTAGHEVVGLARSDASADIVAGLGARVHRGDLDDLPSLQTGAAECDGVVHLGYNHDFSRIPDAARTDLAAIEAIGDVLAGTGAPLLIASGTLGLPPGKIATESDLPEGDGHPRVANARAAMSLADRGVRSIVVRFAPTVHGPGDHGFISRLVGFARENGVSAYVGDGANRWPAVHRLDAASLVRFALEDAPAGAIVHATAEDGVATRTIAEAIGRGLDLPVVSIGAERATEHFSWLGQFFAADVPASSAGTQHLLGWKPTRATLIEDLDAGYYFGS
jgi:nucleoside-diphosphate-sugar epimerase